ncbi:MAG TPA: serine hydrolase domain-containing protein [Streptosporangiaceae bacterium]|nr:serine hydrolase domain-containing protein [Streptosporangiaceae bacterium]
MTNSDAAAHWADRLAEHAKATHVQGATLAFWVDGQQHLAATGVLSAATGVPVTADSLFQIGSITKTWTATMIMQLIDEGKLSLDTTVAQVLPGLRRLGAADIAGQVTVRHLLTHTSGLDGDIFTDVGRGDDCVQRYVEDLLPDAAQVFPVGAAYSYCNSGYVLLGRIIEVLDDRIWDASLRHRLIEPLGLTQTVTLPEEAIMHRAAVGHRDRPRDDEPVPVWGLPRACGPAGTMIASAADVVTFARMHLADGLADDGTRVLSAPAAISMRQPLVKIPGISADVTEVGLSWRLSDWDGRRIYGHGGATLGQNAYLNIDPQARVIACLLTNASDGSELCKRVFSEIFESCGGARMPDGPGPADGALLAQTELARHVGRYERSGSRMDFDVRDGRLHLVLTTTGQLAESREAEPEELDLYPADASGDNFVLRSFDDEPWTPVTFGVLDDGSPYCFIGRVTLKVS